MRWGRPHHLPRPRPRQQAARGHERRSSRAPATISVCPTSTRAPSTVSPGNDAGQASSRSGSGIFTLILLAVIVIGGAVFWKDLFGNKTPATLATPGKSAPPPPKVDPLKHNADMARLAAGNAKDEAAGRDAEHYAPVEWNTAKKTLETADKQFSDSEFALARDTYQQAVTEYAAAKRTADKTPPPGNPLEVQAAADEQLNAAQAKGEATGRDAEHCAPVEWNTAEKTLEAANKQFSEAKFALACDTYQQAATQYAAAKVAAEKVYTSRTQAEVAQREMTAARDAAANAKAQKLSAALWSQAEGTQKSAEAEFHDSQFDSAEVKFTAASRDYLKAKDLAIQLNRVSQAREKYTAEIANPGKEKLDKYGGPAWLAAMKSIAESETSRDPQRIADSYEKALTLLPDAREAAMDPNPDAPASLYKMELKEADLGKLPAGWLAPGGGNARQQGHGAG